MIGFEMILSFLKPIEHLKGRASHCPVRPPKAISFDFVQQTRRIMSPMRRSK